MGMKKEISLNRAYRLLLREYGEQGWWPGDSGFEMTIGAILTQNISWTNVVKALDRLREDKLLSPEALHSCTEERIASLIRSTGYFNQKARKIKNFLDWFSRYHFSFDILGDMDTSHLRGELLSIKGIGPETADSILLYALSKKIFVVDAYTRRIFTRAGTLTGREKYADIQKMFHRGFRGDTGDYNEYHALIVNHGKNVCVKKPLCEKCCLESFCQKRVEEISER
jgi:endonuclease-3 related protein